MRRHQSEVGAERPLGVADQPHMQAGRPGPTWLCPLLRGMASNPTLQRILALVQVGFDPRAVMHPTRL